ncbi:hypothetical protein BW721_08560 [Jeotgalibaca sp. PTS2502]|uniref:phage replisome organizer N-terminal domain-containing protein n=1 Tax=Jeotgalibaca sp. PTS2502 TaxID=1903686 RepID=UPI000973A4B2|nr:phage replisome organizer N-terminal domain-containing protein [Jeotgalibaca sp. PTS2502]APZ49706.1 hypothetical protein BW721_08560 [Jeotgalibaca sp. PTS2502]
MSENKRYYWLKLKEDFFEDDTMQWLEEQENGTEYTLFYLKLCLRSLRSDGRLIRYVGEYLIPYDIKTLAKLTQTDPDTVRVAMDLFKKIGLIDLLDSGEIFLKQLDEMVGSETNKAELMRRKRAEEKLIANEKKDKKRLEVDKVTLLPESYQKVNQSIEKEFKDKSIELDVVRSKNNDNDKLNPFTFYQENGFGTIAPLIRDKIVAIHNDFKEIGSSSYDADHLIIKALEMAVIRNIRNWAYAEKILINWNNKGFKTVMDVDASEKQFQASKNRGTHTFISEESSKTTEELLENSRKRLAADVANTSEEDFSLFR